MAKDIKLYDPQILEACFSGAEYTKIKAVAAFLEGRNGKPSILANQSLGLQELLIIGDASSAVSKLIPAGDLISDHAKARDAAEKLYRARNSGKGEELKGEVTQWAKAFIAAVNQEFDLAAHSQSTEKKQAVGY